MKLRKYQIEYPINLYLGIAHSNSKYQRQGENLERIRGRTKSPYLERNKNKNDRWLLVGNRANKKEVELNIQDDERKIRSLSLEFYIQRLFFKS